MATCHVCPPDDSNVPDEELYDHLRVIHPDLFGSGPERWPDGEIVVHDMTLEPGDFTGGH
ncbi:MAG: hypothetical protein ABW022_08380 [Actinoplanes sp.]